MTPYHKLEGFAALAPQAQSRPFQGRLCVSPPTAAICAAAEGCRTPAEPISSDKVWFGEYQSV